MYQLITFNAFTAYEIYVFHMPCTLKMLMGNVIAY